MLLICITHLVSVPDAYLYITELVSLPDTVTYTTYSVLCLMLLICITHLVSVPDVACLFVPVRSACLAVQCSQPGVCAYSHSVLTSPDDGCSVNSLHSPEALYIVSLSQPKTKKIFLNT